MYLHTFKSAKKAWVSKSSNSQIIYLLIAKKQIQKEPHLRKIRKSNKLSKFENLRVCDLRICDLRNLFVDRPFFFILRLCKSEFLDYAEFAKSMHTVDKHETRFLQLFSFIIFPVCCIIFAVTSVNIYSNGPIYCTADEV
jgi:hypothetical protein